jgi:WD domain, G-beta repeat
MKKKNIPDFQLQRVNSDGSAEEPMICSIEQIDGEWKMGRRGFLAASFALAGLVTGCASVRQQEPPEPDSGKTGTGNSGRPGPEAADEASAGSEAVDSVAPVEKPPVVMTGFCNKNATAHLLKVQTLLFSRDGRMLLSGGVENVLKLWSFPMGKQVGKISNIPTASMALVGAREDIIATADSSSNGILLFDVRTGSRLHGLKETSYDYVNCVAFNPESTILAAGRADSKITLWNVAERRQRYHLEQHTGDVTCVAFSPDGRYMASGAKGEILLWSAGSWRLSARIRLRNVATPNRLVFSPDGRQLAVGAAYDSFVRTYSVLSGGELNRLGGHDYNMNKALAFSPDGRIIATGALNNRIYLWETATGNPVMILKGQRMHDSIQSLAFSPDGKYLVSGGEQTIKIWLMPGGELLTCLCDPATLTANIKISQYTMRDQFGQMISFTLPCGSPLPPGAVCTCNCIPGSWKINYNKPTHGSPTRRLPTRRSTPTPGTRSYCTCNQICTCVPIAY